MQAHASSAALRSQQASAGPVQQQQAVCQAQSYQAKAAGLEKAAEAQTLHAQVGSRHAAAAATAAAAQSHTQLPHLLSGKSTSLSANQPSADTAAVKS